MVPPRIHVDTWYIMTTVARTKFSVWLHRRRPQALVAPSLLSARDFHNQFKLRMYTQWCRTRRSLGGDAVV